MIAAALLLATASSASASLGVSGATLTVRSTDDPRLHGTAHRSLELLLPSGTARSMKLHDGGGATENQSLNLYHGDQERFLLISERDCVVIDPIKGALAQCRKPAVCPNPRTYLGRFDWMNGYDPPHGRFGLKDRKSTRLNSSH